MCTVDMTRPSLHLNVPVSLVCQLAASQRKPATEHGSSGHSRRRVGLQASVGGAAAAGAAPGTAPRRWQSVAVTDAAKA
eukprot:4170172-Pleurochrysis_carterae.AAC.3